MMELDLEGLGNGFKAGLLRPLLMFGMELIT